jgi:hypothetical protein
MLQIVASLIDAARGVIYDRHMFIVQATGWKLVTVTNTFYYDAELITVVKFYCTRHLAEW